MNTKDFLRLGVPLGEATRRATDFVAQYVLRGGDTAKLEDEIKSIVANPALFAIRNGIVELGQNEVFPPPCRYSTGRCGLCRDFVLPELGRDESLSTASALAAARQIAVSILLYMDVRIPDPIIRALVRRGVDVRTAQEDDATELQDHVEHSLLR
jgi:hypothetical protein